ncbi:conserved Plasmodium protein, unknown function [Plasmodium ovale wallikeri]|uniref:Uncharacterized protein n=1 Tax=Plasmodium ovale wallikeri TaxID=864142 RepID=A0A1A9A062_PLAOA|nr:conserved Plasmodium protein, unknown function [Plasmodium ovale wallikeri]SBT49527.1 conserved Plasmodium protein, unknown function [Plasmodium ovale wallikeri]
MRPFRLALIASKRAFSIYNFFLSVRKGVETTLKNDIKYVYSRELLDYERERKDIKDKEKKVRHLVKLTKVNGGIQLKCSMSLIYLLSLKCKYVESIWLNLSKNRPCMSPTCLESIIKSVEWIRYVHFSDLKYIPLKITSVKSKLFDITCIRNTVYKCLLHVETNYHTVGSPSNGEVVVTSDESHDKNLAYKEKKNLQNVWNLLSIHIEENICNVDIKFTGKLSPRFYEYGHINEFDSVKDIVVCQDFNFFSLFSDSYNIKNAKIRDIVNNNVPYWSICEEKKKVQIEHKNGEIGNAQTSNFYKYTYFSNTERGIQNDLPCDDKMGTTSPAWVREEHPKACTTEDGAKRGETVGKTEKNMEILLSSGAPVNYQSTTENSHAQSLNRGCGEMNHRMRNEEEDSHSGASSNGEADHKKEKIEGGSKVGSKLGCEYDLELEGMRKRRMVEHLKNMEIKRMEFYNNSFFLSDDCYDSAGCIYSLVLQKCLRNKKKVNIIWDPFCTYGNIIFESLSYMLNLPLYNEKEILPFMNLKIYDKTEFINMYKHTMNLTASNCNKDVQFIGTDSRHMMIAQCKKNLIRYALYYRDIFKQMKLKEDNTNQGEKETCPNRVKTNYFLNVLKENVHWEDIESEDGERTFFEETADATFGKDMDIWYSMGEERQKKLAKGINKQMDSQKRTQKGTETNEGTDFHSGREAQKGEDPNMTTPEMENVSISTAEDKKYNLGFPIDVSFHKAHFFNVAPFIKNATIITKIPHFSFSKVSKGGMRKNKKEKWGRKHTRMNKKTFTLYEQFDQMLISKSDWTGVYVMTRSRAFLNKSKLKWNKILSIMDSKGRELTLLSWTGRKKSLYSMASEDDKLRELEKFSDQLKFGP